jgi:hypothetical protein
MIIYQKGEFCKYEKKLISQGRQGSDMLAKAIKKAGNGARTRDIHLGKVMLCQLSYSRLCRRPSGRMTN